ncbi:ribosome maturation factor RimM [Metabacillus indicus]|uniref:ribosome maturation factor RimM n=1 Tax=Metabacillus indicus TaxID=246786 RepID=UPI003CE73263
MAEKWFNVGKIVNTHGVKGEVRVLSTTDFPEERYKAGNVLYLFKEGQTAPDEVTVKSHRFHKTFNLLTFEDHPSINDVEKYKNSVIKVPESQLADLEEGEYYFHEIIGCIVLTDEGAEIGTVKEILETGANDVWIIKRKGKKDALIPFIDDVVKEINPEEKRIVISLMEGLIEE